MATVIGIVILIVGLLISIGLHEVGHMVPAKKFGVRVPQYFIGFGPTLWSTKRGETEYGVKAIPLGGYVRLSGMFPPAEAVGAIRKRGRVAELIWDTREASAEEIPPGQEHRAFYRLSVPKKIIVMLGGPVMNFFIAAVLLVVVFCGIGVQGPSTTIGSVSDCIPSVTVADECQNTSAPPALAAGLQEGDRIVSIGGTAITQWSQVGQIIQAAGTSPLEFVVESGGTERTVTITPMLSDRVVVDANGAVVVDQNGTPLTQTAAVVGIAPKAELQPQSLGTALSTLWQGTVATAKVVVTLPVALFDVARSLFTDAPRDPNGLVSIVGVGQIATEIVADGNLELPVKIASELSLLASLNLALFIFNLLPLLPLDGGHIAGALWEGAKKTVARLRGRTARPADTARLMPLTYVMVFVLIGMTILLVVADIVKPLSLTG